MTTIRLRKSLATPPQHPIWPTGIQPAAFSAVDPCLPHQLLETAFAGAVASFDTWHGNLTNDEEFDPDLCVAAVAVDGRVDGFIQCWTSNFIKDLAVAPSHRGKGVGTALMHHVFELFAERGAPFVDLKTSTDGDPAARRLYARLGMFEVPL